MGRVVNMLGMGRPMAAAALRAICSMRLLWAALWLQLPYGVEFNMFGEGLEGRCRTSLEVLSRNTIISSSSIA